MELASGNPAEPERFRTRRVWGAAVFGAVLASMQGAAALLPDPAGSTLVLLVCLPLFLAGIAALIIWLWGVLQDARRLRWRSIASTAVALTAGAAAWWSAFSIDPAAQVCFALARPAYEAAIASLPEPPGHRVASWYWGDVGSVATGGVSYRVLVYDETGAVRDRFADSAYCVDGGPCTLRHIRDNYYVVTSHP